MDTLHMSTASAGCAYMFETDTQTHTLTTQTQQLCVYEFMINVPFACVFRRYPREMNSCYGQSIVARLLSSYSSANREFAKKIVATTNRKRCKFQKVPNTCPKNPGGAYLVSWSKIRCVYECRLYTENICNYNI